MFGHLRHVSPAVSRQSIDSVATLHPVRSTVAPSMTSPRRLPPPAVPDESQTPLKFDRGGITCVGLGVSWLREHQPDDGS